jgi:Domain of unknown function (DUF4375)
MNNFLLRLFPSYHENRLARRREKWLWQKLSGNDPNFNAVGDQIDAIWAMGWPSENAERILFYQSLNLGKQFIWSTWLLQSEVENGGFGQFFRNQSDEFWHEAADTGLSGLGAWELRSIYREARDDYKRHQSSFSADTAWSDYVKIMGVVPMDNRLRKIHSRFLNRMEEFYALRRSFIISNGEQF